MAEQPSATVFVGSLPGDITDEQVSEIFGAYGNIASCKAIPGRGPGAKGAATITFQSTEESEWVVQNLNGNIAQGLDEPCTVKYSSPKGKGGGDAKAYGKAGKAPAAAAAAPYSDGGKKGGGKDWEKPKGGEGKGGEGKGEDSTDCDIYTLMKGISASCPGSTRLPDDHQLYITGLPTDTTDLDLYKMLSPFGAINQRGVKAMRRGQQCTGIGFVDMIDTEVLNTAITTLNGTTMPDGNTLRLMVKNSTRKGEKGGTKGGDKGW